MTSDDIEASGQRLLAVFTGDYGQYPIEEDQRKVGRLTLDSDRKTVFVTYRGSVNSLFEVVSCLFFWKTNLPELLPGKVHAGLGNAFQKVNGSFQRALDDLLADSQIPRDQLKFVIEGYSRGSGLAALTALVVKERFPRNSVNVLTYSTINIFDEESAKYYEALIGDHHWSFLCQEDVVPRIIGPLSCGFCQVGKPITFSAASSQFYNQNVEKKRYAYLPSGSFIAWMLKQLIPVTYWEAHMPHTYQKLAPTAFSKKIEAEISENPSDDPSAPLFINREN